MTGLHRAGALRPVSEKRRALLAEEGTTYLASTLGSGRVERGTGWVLRPRRSRRRVGAASGQPKPPLDPTPETVKLLWLRATGKCELCGNRLCWQDRGQPFGWSVQHRVSRGMGGSTRPELNLSSNLLVLCGSGVTGCHGRVEANPEWAETEGLGSLSKRVDPAAVPVRITDGWVLLDNHGDWRAAS